MTDTVAADLIVPDVWGDAIQPIILGKALMAQVANTDDTLAGQPGDHIDTPFWDYIGDADDLDETTDIVPKGMGMTQDRVAIKEAGTGISLTDKAILTSLGAPQAQARTQLGTSIARKMSKDIMAAAKAEHTNAGASDPYKTTAPLKFDGSGAVLGWNAFVDATTLMGDAYAPEDMAAIVIHSKQRGSLMKDPQFSDVSKYGQGATTLTGEMGRLGNVPVLISDLVTEVDNAGTPNYQALIVSKDALNLYYKRRPLVETDRDILARKTYLTVTAHYAAKRVNDRGVVVVTTQ